MTNHSRTRAERPRTRRAHQTSGVPTMTETAFCKIYPSSGIARVGDSTEPDGWFLGPDLDAPSPHKSAGFTFRDASGRIKRQAARFRIVAFDEAGKPLRELSDRDADISWRVSLANK